MVVISGLISVFCTVTLLIALILFTLNPTLYRSLKGTLNLSVGRSKLTIRMIRASAPGSSGFRQVGVEPHLKTQPTCCKFLKMNPHMGGCQNYGPFLGTLNIRCRIIIRTQKGTLILTTTHIKFIETLQKVWVG